MKKLFTLLLCIVLLTACGQKSLPAEENPPEPVYQVEKSEVPDNSEPLSPAPAEDVSLKDDTSLAAVEAPPEPIKQTVSIVVLGLDGEAVYSSSAEYREGITAFDLLTETAEEKNISVVFSGSKSSPYVTSINGLCEKQHGPSSGWVYTVNGKMVMLSSGKCTLNPDDVVQWKYIT